MNSLDIKSKFSSTSKTIDKIENYNEFITGNENKILKECESIRYYVELHAKCSEIFKKWLEDSINQNIDSIASLITNGLNYIIDDQNLKFKIKQEYKNNRIHMKFVLEQDGTEGEPLHSFGGGAAVVISLILRLCIMQRMGLGNLLILDESMVALANAYVPSAASFMRTLSEQMGVNILMVTHNPEFIQNAHLAYEGQKSDSLKLKCIVRPVP